ncbi:M4 family metallopeptidase [Mesoterricola silvestris]|uniref:Neutral metalloproteinase n=1 Tax=Mesoterricola silvestris TaxID=2927979 RepID=A0AA48GG42_9BACT|nr:M4 family metallopeptidase [Mesoterricola silvestris]BDU72131.1 peptidase [Mesoterricola silvestris]
MPRSLSLALLALGSTLAAQEDAFLGSPEQLLVQELKPSLGLGREDAVKVRAILPDPLTQGRDARIAQFYKGVKVMGGEGILHLSGPRTRSVTDAFVKGLDLDTTPDVPPGEALAVALAELAPRGTPRTPPTSTLVVARLPSGDVLAYRIHAELDTGALEPVHMDFLVDARTARILKRWSSLRTGRAAIGKGISQFSGPVTLNTTTLAKGKGFELRDWTRGRTGNMVVNLDHGTGDDDGKIFTSDTNTWGDGLNYGGGATTAANGETAAVDAAYGLQAAWDYFAKVVGRKGLDDKGTAVTMRVHFGKDYDNAFWADACQCVSIGDGHYFKALASLDIIGHELAHGYCRATADLEYYGESGGLNEANSDINGTLIEFYARGGSGDTIGNWGGNWTIGEDVARPEHPDPLRYLYKPSKDGASPDAWSPDLQFLDVHHSSGPMNRCFYFLSQGASPKPSSDFYTCSLPKGMEGLGNDRAGRIWNRAVTRYLTSGSGYKEAREACVSAAKDLYGAGGPEERAVWDAFHGISLGPAWPR